MAKTLAEALLQAQAAIRPVVRGGINKAQGWRFVEASAIVEAARTALTDAGIVAYMAGDGGEDPDWIRVTLTLTHAESGEQIAFPMPWPVTRMGDQGRRAAYTYARKQALIEALLIADPDDDPETHAAESEPPKEERPRQRGTSRSRAQRDAETLAATEANRVTPAQLAEITAELQRLGIPRDHWRDTINRILGNPSPPIVSSTMLTIPQGTGVLRALRANEPRQGVAAPADTGGEAETVPGPDTLPV